MRAARYTHGPFSPASLIPRAFPPTDVESARAFYGLGGGGGGGVTEASIAQRFEKLHVSFLNLPRGLSVDHIIGRDAHTAFVESEAFAAALAVLLSEFM